MGKVKKAAGKERPTTKRTTSQCNWGPSLVTHQKLKELEEEGLLPSKDEIKWRVPGIDDRPEPVVAFADHVTRGFRPPRSRFFRSMLACYDLHPQDLSANSMLNICHFQVLCEVYLQRRPTLSLFAKFYYCNKQTKHGGSPALECGESQFKSVPNPSSHLPNWPVR